MREAHKNKIIELDLLVPVDLSKVKELMKEDKCFGKEWNPQTNECSVCASSEICGILTGVNLKEEQKKLGTFLDEVNLKIDWGKLTNVVKKYQGHNTPMTVSELYGYVKRKTKSKDKKLLIALIKKYIASDANLYTKDKKIRYRL